MRGMSKNGSGHGERIRNVQCFVSDPQRYGDYDPSEQANQMRAIMNESGIERIVIHGSYLIGELQSAV
jgi:endonuclease IV